MTLFPNLGQNQASRLFRLRPILTVLLVVACKNEAIDETPKPVGTAASSATVEPVPKRDRPWWCICYYRRNSHEVVTACRDSPGQCEELRQLVEKGTQEILERSAITSCVSVLGDHPGDTLGTRADWRPSQKAGAWVSHGACRVTAK